MFTLNRVTGKPIFDIEERPVPKSDLPGEHRRRRSRSRSSPAADAEHGLARQSLQGEPQHQSYCEHMVDDNNMKLAALHADCVQPIQHVAAGTRRRHQLLGRFVRSQASSVYFEHDQPVPADALILRRTAAT
jgi:hypothetical protein